MTLIQVKCIYFVYKEVRTDLGLCMLDCMSPGSEIKSNFLYHEVDEIPLENDGMVIRLFSGPRLKYTWIGDSSLPTSRSRKMDSCLVFTERFKS